MDEVGWEVDSDDDSSVVAELIGRQIKFWREAAGLRVVQFGELMGYGENLIHKVERGARIPRPEFLDRADEVLNAGGHLVSLKPDAEKVRYPKKVRDLARLEAQAVELTVYENHNVDGLLQTKEYSRALFEMRRPAYSEDDIERLVAARMARQKILTRRPAPALSFVQEEATLRRPLGGRMVLRRQLEHLLEVGQLRHVEIQVMPLDRENHAGMAGPIHLLKVRDGSTVGYSDAQLGARLAIRPKEVQLLEMRYGIIRAQALTPPESLAFIEKLRGST
ncbi:helix-turn-helix domain-containing protein [Streptomyces alboflavus]|uniref:helix-turn-helix domain-containing protein n=1 Tax=Streptomyces alboflavus TaxID=67267 RepID=UPI003697AAFA